LNDILTASQAGRISYKQALDLSGIDNLFDLYQAAFNSDVATDQSIVHLSA
jgi:hypothetical protein